MAKKQAEPKDVVEYWLKEIKAARKREERYRKTGKEVFDLYEADQEHETPFNILYSNTETLRPALYSAQPRPVVQRRFKDDDPIGKLASDASRRLLEYHLDTNREDYETLNEAMGSGVLDACLPGRCVIQVKYDADFIPINEPRPPDEQDTDPVDEKDRAEYATKEQVCYESIVWDRFYHGYAKKWTKVPWIAYQFHMTKEEIAGRFGKALAGKLKYHSSQEADDDGEKSKKSNQHEDEIGERKTACVYQIWDKAGGKKLIYVSPNYKDDLLKIEDDPLELTGFFNTPRPLMFVEKSCSLVPTAPYKMYKSQADELNRIVRRKKDLLEACKARAIYDSSFGEDLEKLVMKGDNALIPATVSSSLIASEKGFQNAIWFMPIEVVAAVYQQLVQGLESCKQTIYEITGIADIMRGATNASETLGAQQIKNQWGTLRLKRMQNEVARYVRDLLRMTLEIAATKFDEETWAQMTGLPFVTTQQRQMLEQQAAMLAQMQQPPPPEIQEQLAKPVWGEILKVLKDDAMRSYRIDIETNSTIEPEAAEDQKAMTELLGALSQAMQSFAPLVIQGVLPFEAAQALLLFIARRFRFGSEIEDKLQAMQPPKPPDDGKGQEVEMQQKMMELEKQHAVKEIDFKKKESEMALKEQAMQVEHEDKKRKMDLDLQEMGLQVKQHQFGMQQQVEKGMLDMQKQRANEEIDTSMRLHKVETGKNTVNNMVNDRVNQKLQQGVKVMEALVKELGQAMMQQAQDSKATLESIAQAAARPKKRRAIRDANQQIVGVEESVA